MTSLTAQLWPEPEWRIRSDQLDRLTDPQKRELAVDVAAAAAEAALADDPRKQELVDHTTTEHRLLEIEQALDGEAWDAQDAGDEQTYIRRFREARCASAAIAARLDRADEALPRVLYEVRHALRDDRALNSLLTRLMRRYGSQR